MRNLLPKRPWTSAVALVAGLAVTGCASTVPVCDGLVYVRLKPESSVYLAANDIDAARAIAGNNETIKRAR